MSQQHATCADNDDDDEYEQEECHICNKEGATARAEGALLTGHWSHNWLPYQVEAKPQRSTGRGRGRHTILRSNSAKKSTNNNSNCGQHFCATFGKTKKRT